MKRFLRSAQADAAPAPKRRAAEPRGFAIERGCVTAAELALLRAEADFLAADSPPTFENGCVLDFLASAPLSDGHAARTSAPAYVALRYAERDAFGAAHRAAVERLLFRTLPTVALRHARAGLGVRARRAYLFNEHYVVKPRRSGIEFRWHTDEAEQLAMCECARARATEGPYVSLWLALDDVDRENGCLRVRGDGAAGDADDEGVPLVLRAGDVVAFSSRLWHRSGANTSARPRRAFYAQYSFDPITMGGAPLRLAILCDSAEPPDAPAYLAESDTR